MSQLYRPSLPDPLGRFLHISYVQPPLWTGVGLSVTEIQEGLLSWGPPAL